LTPNRAYLNRGEITLIFFDLRIPGAAARLHSERAAWQEYAHIEILNFHHAVLIVRPGAARRGRAHMERTHCAHGLRLRVSMALHAAWSEPLWVPQLAEWDITCPERQGLVH
jgi:hypothetical protein